VRPFYLIAFCVFSCGVFCAQPPVESKLQFDLSKIGMVVDGEQICEDVGRIQDFPSKVMDQIIAAGPQSVPVLITMIGDARMAKTREPIICYWGGMAMSDIAFCLLNDLFTETGGSAIGGRPTLPGAGYEMLGPPGDLPAWEQLHRYIREHSRAALQARWQALWDKYKDQMFWDPQERCFKLRASQ
jgi:hypothetical protein